MGLVVGPSAAKVVQELSGTSVSKFKFMSSRDMVIHNIPVYVSRVCLF